MYHGQFDQFLAVLSNQSLRILQIRHVNTFLIINTTHVAISKSQNANWCAPPKKIHQHIHARTKKLFLWELINPFWMTGSLLFFGYTQTCWVDDHPWELINPIRNQPWGICSPCYFTRTTSPIFHAHTTHAWLTTSDGTCLVWLIINAVRKLKCFLSLFDSLGSVWALFSAGMRFGDSSLQKVT